ncbi:hypothetical protein SLEP1_g56887 [Rubroshorea leprosula]|uniref:Protein yippee-like n=1 Tax=Rubroshorea leprosula TaxID=152421 RepID=A0AAV5MM01_9ROSI|nr:hypothetical protein SLEP1_g56887 [Rubroshorea leprosula]
MAETNMASCFCCKACNIKIAMSQDYIRRDARTALFKKVVNVQTAGPKDNWQRKGCTLANVYCRTHSCNKALGFRIVSAPHRKLMEGRVVLSLDRLLYWNGKKHSNSHLVHPENRFLSEFDETVVPHFYVCRKCFAHIANNKEFMGKRNNLGWFKDV